MRFLIVDDHFVACRGLVDELNALRAGPVIEQVRSLAEALARLSTLQPDVVFVDLTLGDSSGLSHLPKLARAAPDAKIVIFSGDERPNVREAAFRYGAVGWISKSFDQAQLQAALRELLATGRIGHSEPAAARADAQQDLSRREMEVLALLDQGDANKVIARKLNVSADTVKAFTQRIYRKLGSTNRTQAVREAHQRGLL